MKSLVAFTSIIALTILLYWQITDDCFLRDDFIWIERGLRCIESPGEFLTTTVTGTFRPLVLLVSGGLHLFFGLDSFPHHIFQLLLHGLVVWLLFLIVQKHSDSLISFQVAGITAALFLFSAAYTHNVFWISSKSSGGMFCLFFLLMIYLHEKHPVLSFVSFVLGCLCSEIGILAPLVLVGFKRRNLGLVPFFVFSVL